MEVAIVSDTHFGYRWGSEREDDSFDNAREAFRRTRDADLVILPGDIFDKKVPKQEVLGKSVDCFNEYRSGECRVQVSGESDVEHQFSGTPVVAIHGTHERRSKGFTNPIELLEKMDYLLHLHNEKVVFEKDGEKVAVHGMSGVPERYAPKVLEKYDPEPVEDAYNIFVFHQSVEGLVYTDPDQEALKMEHLPEGFDLLVDGHIHWKNFHLDGDKPLIIPGSTVSTQMRKVEAEQPKGFVTVDTERDEVDFHELETPRKLFYEEVDVKGLSSAEIMSKVDDRMEEILDGYDKKPLVRLILSGESNASVKKSEIRERYEDEAVLSVSLRMERGESGEGASLDRDSEGIAEMGRAMLREKMEGSVEVEDLFDLLADEELDEAMGLVEDMDVDKTGSGDEEESSDGGTRTLSDF
ncbi:MAG: DNA repair exonuclease [Candidatus Nanohaloarchaea archaeon]|nr:DNA repair exonuclease [Candidatus Nanohaloarchaea archaeon]